MQYEPYEVFKTVLDDGYEAKLLRKHVILVTFSFAHIGLFDDKGDWNLRGNSLH